MLIDAWLPRPEFPAAFYSWAVLYRLSELLGFPQSPREEKQRGECLEVSVFGSLTAAGIPMGLGRGERH